MLEPYDFRDADDGARVLSNLLRAGSPARAGGARRAVEDPADGSEEALCRICRGPAEEDQPLSAPCLCSGSIKWIHEDCLMQWIRHSKAKEPIVANCLARDRWW